jgi:hypothetical protein
MDRNSLEGMSIEKLKFERQRRVDQISGLRSEAARSRARAEQIDDMPPDPYDPDMTLDSGPTWAYINRIEDEMRGLQREVNVIEDVLSRKL